MDKFGRFAIEPFFYPDQLKAVISVNFQWMLSELTDESKIKASIFSADTDEPLRTSELNPKAARNEDEAQFDLKELKPGDYEVRISLEGSPEKTETVKFSYPFRR